MGLPLDRYTLLEEGGADAARRVIARLFHSFRLDPVARDGHVGARVHARRLRNVAFSYVAYESPVRISLDKPGQYYVVLVPLSGSRKVRSGGRMVVAKPSVGAVLSPDELASGVSSAKYAHLAVRIERPALEARLRELLDEPLARPIEFDLGFDLGNERGQSWIRKLWLCVQELNAPSGLVEGPIQAAAIDQLVLTGLLMSQRHNYADELLGQARSVPPRVVSDVIDLIQSNPAWPHTVTSLARAAGVSVRTLEDSFRKHLGSTPYVYLRNVRLDRTHDELLAAAPDVTTVSEIAGRWGFMHFGWFASRYRQRFGELPSETLRR